MDDLAIRDATADERRYADRVYASIDFATTAEADLQLVALHGALVVGLGRLVDVGDGAVELGGIWTAASARGAGVAAAMVRALLARAGEREVWCVPFRELVDYYARFDFVEAPPTLETRWPAGVVRKADLCAARGQDVAILRLHRRLV